MESLAIILLSFYHKSTNDMYMKRDLTISWTYHMFSRYLVTPLMGADLNMIMKVQALTDEHVQFLIYQLLRGLKVSPILH